MLLWFHTHDTASNAIAQNLAAIEGGADGIDLSKSPCWGNLPNISVGYFQNYFLVF